MKKSIIDHTTLSELNNRYSRESQNVRFDLMLKTTFVIVGLGASGPMIEQFARLGIKRFHLFDPDAVELKNVISQSYTVKDDGLEKAEATKRKIEACEFEKGNPDIPPIEINTNSDFLSITDADVLHCCLDPSVTHQAHDLLGIMCDLCQPGGAGVAQIMEPDATQAGGFQNASP